MGRIVKKRLRLRPRAGGISIDRWINFVVGEVADDELLNLRGAVFEVPSEWDIKREMRGLRALAEEARAEGREAEFLDALDARAAPAEPGSGPTFAEFAEEWEEVALIADNVTAAELESTRSILRLHLVPFFGSCRIASIDRRRIDRFKARQRRASHQFGVGYAASTINNQLSVLRRVLARAQAYGLIEQVPMDESVWMRTERVEDDENWLPAADEQRLAVYLWGNRHEQPRRYLALLTQLMAGLQRAARAGEVGSRRSGGRGAYPSVAVTAGDGDAEEQAGPVSAVADRAGRRAAAVSALDRGSVALHRDPRRSPEQQRPQPVVEGGVPGGGGP